MRSHLTRLYYNCANKITPSRLLIFWMNNGALSRLIGDIFSNSFGTGLNHKYLLTCYIRYFCVSNFMCVINSRIKKFAWLICLVFTTSCWNYVRTFLIQEIFNLFNCHWLQMLSHYSTTIMRSYFSDNEAV